MLREMEGFVEEGSQFRDWEDFNLCILITLFKHKCSALGVRLSWA